MEKISLRRRIAELETQLKQQKSEIEELQRLLSKGPMWTNKDGEAEEISDMNDTHLINAVRCVLRCDRRYVGYLNSREVRRVSKKMVELFHMISELHKRELAHCLQSYLEDIEEYAGKVGPLPGWPED